ncbi:hypothetical protein GGR50DRAFT_328504 [Xylaria sp. CBS 124048]|nr:hypothetical protein GGR50DRAFT_328504 [Xylaria sp. CBS 124048]
MYILGNPCLRAGWWFCFSVFLGVRCLHWQSWRAHGIAFLFWRVHHHYYYYHPHHPYLSITIIVTILTIVVNTYSNCGRGGGSHDTPIISCSFYPFFFFFCAHSCLLVSMLAGLRFLYLDRRLDFLGGTNCSDLTCECAWDVDRLWTL